MSVKLSDLNGVETPAFRAAIGEYFWRHNVLVKSGAAIGATPQELGLNDGGSRMVEIPILGQQNMAHDDLVDTDTPTTVRAIPAHPQIARNLFRGNGWGETELAKFLLKTDPLNGIAELMGQYWSTNVHTAILYTLKGLFSMASGSSDPGEEFIPARYKDSKSVTLTGDVVRDGIGLMGDQRSRVTLALMHSAVFEKLDRQEEIVQVQDADLTLYPTLRGTNIRIFVDDTMPLGTGGVPDVGADKSRIYYLGEGAFTVCTTLNYIKIQEKAEKGQHELHNRRVYLAHPNGFTWSGEATLSNALTPTNAQLGGATAWKPIGSLENILVVAQDVAV